MQEPDTMPHRAPIASVRAIAVLMATLPQVATATPSGATLPDGIEVGVIAYRYLYKEPGLMQLEGPKLGIRGSYGRTDGAGRHGRIEAMASYGQVDYESNGTGTSSNHDDTTIEVRLLAGMDFGVEGSMPLMPYAGLGYRYLYNDLRGQSSTGHFGYRRESNYLYLPVGLWARAGNLRGNIEVAYLLRGHQMSYLSDGGFGDPDARNDQDKGFGARASLMVDVDRWSIGPWINYWRIADSEIAFGGLEPRNRTTEVGIDLRYRF